MCPDSSHPQVPGPSQFVRCCRRIGSSADSCPATQAPVSLCCPRGGPYWVLCSEVLKLFKHGANLASPQTVGWLHYRFYKRTKQKLNKFLSHCIYARQWERKSKGFVCLSVCAVSWVCSYLDSLGIPFDWNCIQQKVLACRLRQFWLDLSVHCLRCRSLIRKCFSSPLPQPWGLALLENKLVLFENLSFRCSTELVARLVGRLISFSDFYKLPRPDPCPGQYLFLFQFTFPPLILRVENSVHFLRRD